MTSQRMFPAILLRALLPGWLYLLPSGPYLPPGGFRLSFSCWLYPPPGGPYLPPGGFRLSLSCWLLLLGLVIWPARTPAEPINFGEGLIYAECLLIVAESYLNRQGGVDNHDWVTMRVTNNCESPIKHLQVALILLDAGGTPYGTSDWLLERGIYLPPGKSRFKKVAIPDSDNRIAVRWEVKVLKIARAGPGRQLRRK